MKVKALASLSTPQGARDPGEEFSVTAAELDDLVTRGLVERVSAEPVAEVELSQKAPKQSKTKA